MTAWTSDELRTIEKADELRIASMRTDGTLRKPVIIWVVRLGDDLYVRAVNGRTGLWFRHAQERHAGQIRAGAVDKDVTFIEAGDDASLNDKIDAAYASKYSYSPSAVRSVTSAAARLASIRLVPREVEVRR